MRGNGDDGEEQCRAILGVVPARNIPQKRSSVLAFSWYGVFQKIGAYQERNERKANVSYTTSSGLERKKARKCRALEAMPTQGMEKFPSS